MYFLILKSAKSIIFSLKPSAENSYFDLFFHFKRFQTVSNAFGTINF